MHTYAGLYITYLKYVLQQIHGRGAEVSRHVELSQLYLLEQDGHITIIKWQSATEQGIQDDAAGPYVHLRAYTQMNMYAHTTCIVCYIADCATHVIRSCSAHHAY